VRIEAGGEPLLLDRQHPVLGEKAVQFFLCRTAVEGVDGEKV